MNTESPATRTPPSTHNNHLGDDNNSDDGFRDIHALTPPSPPPLPVPPSRQRVFEASSRRSSNLSVSSDITNSSENFTTMSTEFNALVLAGSAVSPNNDYYTSNQVGGNGNGSGNDRNNNNNNNNNNNINLDRIGEEEGEVVETNPLAIVPDNNPMPSPPEGHGIGNRNHSSLGHLMGPSSSSNNNNSNSSSNNTGGAMAVHNVKKEEVETKIVAWQTAKVSKINNRFKREDAIISGWENEQVHRATSWMKKVERKLEEKRAKAMEKMQNDIAKAHRKAEERRASAEGKRGTKVAKVLEVANLMRAVGRPPAKRSFF